MTQTKDLDWLKGQINEMTIEGRFMAKNTDGSETELVETQWIGVSQVLNLLKQVPAISDHELDLEKENAQLQQKLKQVQENEKKQFRCCFGHPEKIAFCERCMTAAIGQARAEERSKWEKKLREKFLGANNYCNVCGMPMYLIKDKTCYGCKTLFAMKHEEVMKGDYQTRFTSGIHRQALNFAYTHCVQSYEEGYKRGYFDGGLEACAKHEAEKNELIKSCLKAQDEILDLKIQHEAEKKVMCDNCKLISEWMELDRKTRTKQMVEKINDLFNKHEYDFTGIHDIQKRVKQIILGAEGLREVGNFSQTSGLVNPQPARKSENGSVETCPDCGVPMKKEIVHDIPDGDGKAGSGTALSKAQRHGTKLSPKQRLRLERSTSGSGYLRPISSKKDVKGI